MFNSPSTSDLEKMQSYLTNAGLAGLLPEQDDAVSLFDQISKKRLKLTSGVAIYASINFGHPSADSVTSHLDVISNGELSESTEIILSGYFIRAADATRIISFTGTITSIQLLTSITLSSLKLQYTSEIAKDSKSNSLLLEGDCHVKLGDNKDSKECLLKGQVLVNEEFAKVEFKLKGELTLSETIGLKLSDVGLLVTYTFGESNSGRDTHNIGKVKSGDRSATYQIALTASIDVGSSITARVKFIYAAGSSSVLVIDVPVDLNIGVLFGKLFDESFPTELLDIAFHNLLIYYAWKDGIVVDEAIARGPKARKYIKGFHAEAHVNVFGE